MRLFVYAVYDSCSGIYDRRLYTATKGKTHYLNIKPRPQRGGIRL